LDCRERDVVILGVPAAEILHPVDNRLHQKIHAARARRLEYGLQLFLAELVALVIQRFVDSIGLNHHGVQW
jgi:hypothetical protein